MTLNYAHRGASGNYPENTMLAFEKAIEMGCHGIETDVHLTKDNVPVLCHDELIDRTTDGIGFIKDYTYNELRRFDAGVKFGSSFKGLRIPSIDEFIELIKSTNLIMNLELKNNLIDYDNLESIIIEKSYKNNIQNRIVISSFNHYSIVKCKELDKSIKVGFLYDNPLFMPGRYGKFAGVNALHPNYHTLKEEVVREIKSNGLEINTYTVNGTVDMQRLIDFGVDGIITNYPDKLNALLV